MPTTKAKPATMTTPVELLRIGGPCRECGREQHVGKCADLTRAAAQRIVEAVTKAKRKQIRKPATRRVRVTKGPWLTPSFYTDLKHLNHPMDEVDYRNADGLLLIWPCVDTTQRITGLTMALVKAAIASGAQIRFSAEIRTPPTARKGRR